jgi:P-type E1-E2 ATPase
MSKAAKHGAVIKGGAILESLARTESVLFDKTGTLTHGGPSISQMESSPELSDNEVLLLAASLDQYSSHVVARAIVSEAKLRGLELEAATHVLEEHGHGIKGDVRGMKVEVGQISGIYPKWLTFDHQLMVGISINGELKGAIGLVDPLRNESKEMIQQLRMAGVKRILLVSGDRIETAQQVADAVGITEVHASVSAAQKMELAEKQIRETKGIVVVVGDGINDAPALAAAHVGVAMGARGATAASEAADVVIVEDSIDRLTMAIAIAKGARRKAIQAAGIGMFLSFFAMLAGAGGALDASKGAITQEFIDVIAILWALTTLMERPE